AVRDRLINADRIEEPRQRHVAHAGVDAIIQMQAAADVADMAFDFPDGFPAAAAAAEQRQIVAVALRVIAGDQTEQGGFAGAVWADYLPVFTRVNLPVEMIEDRPIVIADHAVTQDDQRTIRRQDLFLRRILRFRQRQPAEVFAVRQLRHQRVRHHLAARPAVGQGAVRQHAHLPDKIRYFVETVEHQHHGLPLGGKLAQQRGELRARVHVQPVERF
ncbi:hypothetical protein RF55_25682, partial [Lasius niger]